MYYHIMIAYGYNFIPYLLYSSEFYVILGRISTKKSSSGVFSAKYVPPSAKAYHNVSSPYVAIQEGSTYEKRSSYVPGVRSLKWKSKQCIAKESGKQSPGVFYANTSVA